MKKFLLSLFCKKSALLVSTACASALITTTAIVPSIKNDNNEQVKNEISQKNTKKIQNNVYSNENLVEPVDNESSINEETIENAKPYDVFVDFSKVAQLSQSSSKTEESVDQRQEEVIEQDNKVTEENKELSSTNEVEPTGNEQQEQEVIPQNNEVTEENKELGSTNEVESTGNEQQEQEVKPQDNEVTEENNESDSTSEEQKENEQQEQEVKPQDNEVIEGNNESGSTNEEQKENEQQEQETTPQGNVAEENKQPSTQNLEKNNSSTEESSEQNNYIEIIQQALQKTKNVESVYFTRYRTGIYPENSKIKFNRSQNRHWYSNGEVEEYIEGFPGRYTTEFNPVKYFYQTWWLKYKQTNTWEKRGTLHSVYGISELGYLSQIKSVEKLNINCPYSVYVVTLDQNFANKASENLLNTPNMFNQDVTITVMIDFDGYIRSIDSDWQKEVLNNPSIGPVKITVHIGDFNSTNINRPSDLNDEPVNYRDTRDDLTPTKKENIKNNIYEAYKKTYDANNATYEVNGKKVEYDIQSNSALVEDSDGTITYYDGKDGKYIDHNYVTDEYHHESWTKFKNSNVWVKNVNKHTCFIPRELYFLNTIFDVSNVEVQSDVTIYTIEVLKQYANSAYSYSYNTSDSIFNSNITFTVSIDKYGYIKEIHINSEGYKLDLVISNVNNTNVERPSDIK